MKKALVFVLALSMLLLAFGCSSPTQEPANGIASGKITEAKFEIVAEIAPGSGDGEVGYIYNTENAGPDGFIVKDDGSIAVLDTVNERILIYKDNEHIDTLDYSSIFRYTVVTAFGYQNGSYYLLERESENIYAIDENSGEATVVELPDGVCVTDILAFREVNKKMVMLADTAGDIFASDYRGSKAEYFEVADDGKSFVKSDARLRITETIPTEDNKRWVSIKVNDRTWNIRATAGEVVGNYMTDGNGNLCYLVTELVTGTAFFCGETTIRVCNSRGEVTGYALLSNEPKFSYPSEDLYYTPDGDVYYMSCDFDAVRIYRVTMGTTYTSNMDAERERAEKLDDND